MKKLFFILAAGIIAFNVYYLSNRNETIAYASSSSYSGCYEQLSYISSYYEEPCTWWNNIYTKGQDITTFTCVSGNSYYCSAGSIVCTWDMCEHESHCFSDSYHTLPFCYH